MKELLELPELLNLEEWVTIRQGASEKQVSDTALRMYLRLHPEIERRKIGATILVRRVDLDRYVPNNVRVVE